MLPPAWRHYVILVESPISGKVFDEIEGKIDPTFESRGEQTVKNIEEPIRAHALRQPVPFQREQKVPNRSLCLISRPLPSYPSQT